MSDHEEPSGGPDDDGAGPEEERRRAPLSHTGGDVQTRGDEAAAASLAEALNAVDHVDRDELTHGFHTYPARMHPGIARSVIAAFSQPEDLVLDPFCGSGTVLVEAVVAGRRSVGVDLNPLGLRLAAVKTELRRPATRDRFIAAAEVAAEASEARVRGRVDARADLPKEEVQYWSGHTLKELAGLIEEIRTTKVDRDLWALEAVFSAILLKVSKQRSETAQREMVRRIRKGLPTELFLRKAQELSERWESLSDAAPDGAHRPTLIEGDARRLADLLRPDERADLILTSPPYGGTYDYVDHHARRYAWLGIDPTDFERDEVGARRRMRGHDGVRQWDREVGEFLSSLAGARRRQDGPIVLLLGDGQVGQQRIPADGQVARLAPRAKLELVAAASQERPDFRGGKPRREHLLLLS